MGRERGGAFRMSAFAARHGLPALGAGVGLRFEHVARILAESPRVPWSEVVSGNYMTRGGLTRRHIREAAERWPIVCHGVSMNLGSTDRSRTGTSRSSRRSPT